MSRILQLLQGLVLLAIALSICIYPTQQAQPYHIFNLTEDTTKPNPNYGIFYFGQTWPRASCIHNGRCHGPNSSFTVHGLWPQYTEGRRCAPRMCCRDEAPDCKFKETLVSAATFYIYKVFVLSTIVVFAFLFYKLSLICRSSP